MVDISLKMRTKIYNSMRVVFDTSADVLNWFETSFVRPLIKAHFKKSSLSTFDNFD